MSVALQPRPHQVEALANLVAAFAVHDRVQLVMACGTGKTLVGRWHAEASEAREVLVLVPSLALLAQTLREWRRQHSWRFEALVVCSDPSTSAGAAEREDGAAADPDWATVQARVTTDPTIAAAFLGRARADRPQVIFSTYHSAPVVAAAQRRSGLVFDLAICDEAHRLAGSPREEFGLVLDSRAVVARRRLFMTATPRVAGGCSMDDPRLFGPVAHTVSFGDAIAAGLLVDYQVLVVGARADAEQADDPRSTVPAAVLDVIDRHGARKVLTFHSLVSRAAAFAAAVHGATTSSGRRVAARHLSGAMPTSTRSAGLAWLADPAATDVRLIANARVLNEGIDVPAVDAVCFADARSSVIDIVQAVGRVLRPSPGKRIGSIVVPVTLPADGDDDTELLLSRFSTVWTVLKGLRSHDQRFAGELAAAVHSHVRHGRYGHTPPRVRFFLPAAADLDQVRLRLVQDVGDAWERFFAGCREWAFAHPGRRLPRQTRWQDMAIGEWAVKQRTAHAHGVLPPDRARRLESLPDWYWDLTDAAWADSFSVLRAFAAAYGTVAENATGPSVFEGLSAARADGRRLGFWLAAQRQAHRDGLLDPGRAAQLESLPGWTWHPASAEDLAHVDALRRFVEFEHHAVVPDGYVEDGLKLGRWVWNVRRRKLTGTLSPALEDEIWAATPSRWRAGARVRWQWEKPETQWRLGFTALRQFTAREGHASPASGTRERLEDGPVRLGQWVSVQRHQHRKGELDPAKVRALEALPGWRWDGSPGGARPAQPPLELPAHLQHGAAGAAARGCHCQPCNDYRRSADRRRLARIRDARAAAGVPAGRARRHLRHLEEKIQAAYSDADRRRPGIGRALVAATSGVPLGVLRSLAEPDARILAEQETRLLATTVEACLSNVSHAGSRGRGVQRSGRLVDAAPTRELIRDLEARGFTLGWIGRELGYARALQLCGDTVTLRIARQIADLHRAVGDLSVARVRRNQPLPRLADLRRDRKVA